MVEYLSGGRIQGSTTGSSTTTTEQNLFNLTYATENNATITSGNDPTGKCVVTHSGSNPESKAYATLTNSYNAKTFTIDFTIKRNSGDTANNWAIVFGSDVWDDNSASGNNKRIMMRYVNGNRVDFMLDSGGSTYTEDQTLTLQGTNTTKYYRITGNGTTAKCEYWASSNRSGTADESTDDLSFPSAWLTEDAINKITFGGWGGGGNAIDVEFSDVEISFTVATDEKDDITNVPANSRYEETDTRKIFRAKSGKTWTESTQDNWWSMYENYYYGIKLGASFELNGKTISQVEVWLKKDGSPTYNTTVEVIRGSTVEATSATVAMSTVTSTTGEWITYTFSSGVALQENDYIVFKQDGNQSSSNYVFVGNATKSGTVTTWWSNSPFSAQSHSGVIATMEVTSSTGMTWTERNTA